MQAFFSNEKKVIEVVKMNNKAIEALRKQAMREYKRKWRQANPDKVAAAQKRYWTKKGMELASMKAGEKDHT